MHAAARLVLTLVFLMASRSAMGQEPPRTTVPEQRSYIAAQAGAVSGPPTEVVLSVEYGERFHPDVEAYVTLSYFENLMPRALRRDLRTLGSLLSAVTNDPWELRGRDRGVAFLTGARYLFGNGNVRPYLGAGAGIVNLRRTVVEARLGEVTGAVFNDFDLGDGALSLAARGITRPLAEAVAGVSIGAGHTHVDVGYRYRRAFRLPNVLDFSQLNVGVGYRF